MPSQSEQFVTSFEDINTSAFSPQQMQAFERFRQGIVSERQIAQDSRSIDSGDAQDVAILGTDGVRDQVETDNAELGRIQEQQRAISEQLQRRSGEREQSEQARRQREFGTTDEGEVRLIQQARSEALNAGLSLSSLREAGVNPNDPLAIRDAVDTVSREGVVGGVVVNPELARLDKTLDDATDQVRNIQQKMTDIALGVAGDDPATLALIETINQSFNGRIESVKQINRSQREQIERVGIRLGTARFAPTIAGGIVSEQERQGLARIDALKAQRSQAIAEARIAAETRKFDRLHKLLGEAQTAQEQAMEEISSFNETLINQNEEISESALRAQKDFEIAQAFIDGLTSPLEILNKLGDGFTLEEIDDALDILNPEMSDNLTGDLKQFKDAQRLGEIPKNMTFNEFLESIGAAKFTGDIKEFQDAQRLGIIPKDADFFSFLQKKRSASGVGSITPTQLFDRELKLAKNFESVAGEASDARRQQNQMEAGLKQARQRIEKGESINAASQAVLVTFQKILDPTSVVRESEYARSGAGLPLIGRIEGQFTKLQSGGAGVRVKDLEEFVELGREFIKGYEESLANDAQLIRNQAQSIGANLERVLPPDALRILEKSDDTKSLRSLAEERGFDPSEVDILIDRGMSLSDIRKLIEE